MPDFISFKTLKRPPKPNTYLVAPEDTCLAAEPDRFSPQFDLSPDDMLGKIEQLIAGERGWIDPLIDSTTYQIHFIARSALMRFKDDVDIAIFPSGSGSQIAIYSRSRVGYSDLGANKKRVESLLEKLIAK